MKINPNGRIPAILDGSQRVFESGAIMLYLTEKYDQERKISYAPGTSEYVEQLSWLMYQMGGVGPMQGNNCIPKHTHFLFSPMSFSWLIASSLYTGQANHFRLFAGARSDYGINRYISETKRLYSALESRLKESPFLAGSKYTIADIANYSWVRSAPVALEIDLAEWPALKKWAEGIEKREAVSKGVDVPKRDITPEQMAEKFKSARARIDGMTNSDQH